MNLWFDRIGLFDRVFEEELVVEKARERNLKEFKKKLKVTLKDK